MFRDMLSPPRLGSSIGRRRLATQRRCRRAGARRVFLERLEQRAMLAASAFLPDVGNDAVYTVDLTNGTRAIFSQSSNDGAGRGSGPEFENLSDIALLANGDALATDKNLGAIFRVDANTGDRTILTGSGAGSGPALLDPHGLTVDPSGNAYVTDTTPSRGSSIFRVDAATGDREMLVNLGPTGLPLGITFHNGMLFFAEPNRLQRLDLETNTVTVVSDNSTGTGPGFGFINDLAVDPSSGELFVTDQTNVATAGSAIFRVDPANGNRQIITDALTLPNGIDFAEGLIYVSDDAQNSFFKINPANGNTAEVPTGGEEFSDLGFGLGVFCPEPASISGLKFWDKDANGVQDADEPGLEGWTIELAGFGSTVTDASGAYSFTGLDPGTYGVSEVVKDGWRQTTAPGNYTVTLKSGDNISGIDFGNTGKGTVHGFVFWDKNRSLSKEGGNDPLVAESGLPGFTVLMNILGEEFETTSDGDGNYQFDNVPPGNVNMSQRLSGQLVMCNTVGWAPTGSGISFPLGPNETRQSDTPLTGCGVIEGVKFWDENENGIKDAGEGTTEEIWTITADWSGSGAGADVQATTSKDDGTYQVRDLPPGQFTLKEVQDKPGWEQTKEPDPVTLGINETVTEQDFGNSGIDFAVEPFGLAIGDVVVNADGTIVLTKDVTVTQKGGTDENTVLISFEDGLGKQIMAPTMQTVSATTPVVVTVQWDITSLLRSSRGVTDLTLEVEVTPPANVIDVNPPNNVQAPQLPIDVRPMITDVKFGFRPGVFLQFVSLENPIEVFVDWNGDLAGLDFPAGANVNKRYQFNLPNAMHSVPFFTTPAPQPVEASFDMGADLTPGPNQLQITVISDFGTTVDNHQFQQAEVPLWIGLTQSVSAIPKGAAYDKVAVYEQGTIFPENLAITGKIGITGVPLMDGDFGLSVEPFTITSKFHSNQVSELKGKGGLSMSLGSKEAKGKSKLKGGVGVTFNTNQTTLIVNGHTLDLDAGIEITFGLNGSVETPKVRLPGVLAFLSVSAEIGGGVDATFVLEQQPDGSLDWTKTVFGVEAFLKAILSVGGGPVEASGGIGGKPRAEFQLPPEPCLLKQITVQLIGSVSAKFFFFTEELELAWPDPPLVLTSCSSGSSAPLTAEVSEESAALEGLTISSPPAVAQQLANNFPAINYSSARPAFARQADGTMTIVYVDQDATKAFGQNLEIMAANFDGNNWSAPVPLTDNTLLDHFPSVAYDSNGRPVATWTQVKNSVADPENSEPSDILPDMEIVFSVQDPATGEWSAPAAVTSDAEMDMLPRLARNGSGNLAAVWVHESDNNTPIFPGETTPLDAELRLAFWNGSEFSVPETAVSGAGTNELPELAYNGNQSILVWSDDQDGNRDTPSDTLIRAAVRNGGSWSAPETLAGTDDSLADREPRVLFDSAGRGNVIWVKNEVPLSAELNDVADQVFFSEYVGGSFTAPTMAFQAGGVANPQLFADGDDNLILLYEGVSLDGPDLFYSVYDRAAQSWGQPVQLTETPEVESSSFGFVTDTGMLEVLHRDLGVGTTTGETMVDGSPVTVDIPVLNGSSALAASSKQLGLDLAVGEPELSGSITPGSTVQVSAPVRNAGDLFVTPIKVAFFDGENQIGQTLTVSDLAAGIETTATIDWTIPQDNVPHTVTVRVDPDNEHEEVDETNNDGQVVALLPDLVVDSAITTYGDNSLTIDIVLVNEGSSAANGPFSVALKLDDAATGTVVATQEIPGVLAAGESVDVSFELNDPAALFTGKHTGYVVADVNDDIVEQEETNNNGLTDLNVLPNLAISAPAKPGGPFVVTNTGFLGATDVRVEIRRDSLGGSLVTETTLATLAPGETADVTTTGLNNPVTLFGMIDPAFAIAEFDESDNVAVVTGTADTSVVTTVLPTPAVTDQTVTWTLTIANAGPSGANGVTVRHMLPAGMDFVSADDGCSESGGTVTCNIGNLANGGQTTVTVQATSAATGTYSAAATVSSLEFDPSAEDNMSDAEVIVNPKPVIVITESDGATQVSEPDSTDTFTVALDQQPTATIILSVVSGDEQEVTISPSELMFTPGDFNVPQTVTVAAFNDALIDGAQMTDVTIGVTDTGGDARFAVTDNRIVRAESIDNDVDDDADGPSTETENAHPNNGDGNGDGTPDSLQSHVASLPNPDSGLYATLAASDPSLVLRNVHFTANPSPADTPADIDFNQGFLDFEVANVPNGGSAIVTLLLENSQGVSTFYRYGPTPANTSPHWYRFLYSGTTGAEILPDRIVFHLMDGQRGDDDLTANGTIVDPGAPAANISPTPWTNPNSPLDINDDGFISPIDALVTINEQNQNGSHALAVPPVPPISPFYLDANGDNFVSPIDALLVINDLNANGSHPVQPAGEGESPATVVPPVTLPGLGKGAAPMVNTPPLAAWQQRTQAAAGTGTADQVVHSHVVRLEESIEPRRELRQPSDSLSLHRLGLRDLEDPLADDDLDSLLGVIAEDVGEAWNK